MMISAIMSRDEVNSVVVEVSTKSEFTEAAAAVSDVCGSGVVPLVLGLLASLRWSKE